MCAPRASRAHRRLHLACGRRHAHAQRRPERRPSSSSTRSSCTRRSSGSPARTARSTCRGGLMLADTEVRMDFLRMAVARGRYLGMDLELISRQRGAGPLPAARPAVLRRGAVRPGRGPRRPDRRHARLRQVRPAGRRGGPPPHDGHGLSQRPDGTWDVEHRGRRPDPCRARRQRRRAVGARGRPDGRARAAGPGHGAHYLLTAGHARGRGARRRHRPRDADGARLRRRDLHPPGRRRRCCWDVRAGGVPWSPRETPWDFGSQLLKPDLDRITPGAPGRVQALPGDGHDRDQAGRQRAVHLLARRQSRWSVRSAGCAATGSPAASWPACRRVAASGWRSRPG